MSSSYRVQGLIDQNTESMVQRVVTEEGAEFMLTRLKLSPQMLASLFGEEVFSRALESLRSLRHRDLREVVDGGMDEEDGSPWVTSPWIEGQPLSVQDLKEKDIRNLAMQCQQLVGDLGDWAKVVDFDPAHILSVRTSDGELHARFAIDYFRWFESVAEGNALGAGRSAADEVRKLLEGLVIKQLKNPSEPSEPSEERKGTPIPLVEDRSPALTAYQAPRTGWVMPALAWLGFFVTLGVITWLTLAGMKRVKENPRKEIPVWNAGGR